VDEIDGQDDKDLEVHMTVSEEASNSEVLSAQPLAEGQGKRMKISNHWYTVKSFIHHNDDDDWRVDI
jgi:hypothetical protein